MSKQSGSGSSRSTRYLTFIVVAFLVLCGVIIMYSHTRALHQPYEKGIRAVLFGPETSAADEYEFRFRSQSISKLWESTLAHGMEPVPPVQSGKRLDLDSDPRARLLTALARKHLEHWISVPNPYPNMFSKPLVTDAMRQFIAGEPDFMTHAALLRIVDGKVFIRLAMDAFAVKWWIGARMNSTLTMIFDALDLYSSQLGDVRLEMAINLADLPRTVDSQLTQAPAGVPVFSVTSSSAHVDVMIPDVVDLGKGYMPSEKDLKAVPHFFDRKSRALYVGSPRPFATGLHNYGGNTRLRLKYMSLLNGSNLDVSFHQWTKLVSPNLQQNLQQDGITISNYVDAVEKASYKYLVVASGAAHSCSLCGGFMAGQVVIAQDMAFGEFYYPAMRPGLDFIPTRKSFSDLPSIIEDLNNNPEEAYAIAQRGKQFGELFCTTAGRTLYWAILLREFNKLMDEPEKIVPPEHLCSTGIDYSKRLYVDCFNPKDDHVEELIRQSQKYCHSPCLRPDYANASTWMWIQIR
jgi:hypothetical protein